MNSISENQNQKWILSPERNSGLFFHLFASLNRQTDYFINHFGGYAREIGINKNLSAIVKALRHIFVCHFGKR